MAAAKTWRATKRVDFLSSATQIARWLRAAKRDHLTLSAWIRKTLDEAAR